MASGGGERWGRKRTAVLALALVFLLAPVVLAHDEEASPKSCKMSLAEGERLIRAYSDAGRFLVRQRGGDVLVEVPGIDFDGPGESTTLPVGPCQHIYRFKFPKVHVAGGHPSPFRYVEVDWNTEGESRGPNDSFVSPHFDFHFYLRSRRSVDALTPCVVSTNGKTCDPLRTGYVQMRRFLRLPPPAYIPAGYRPDVGSSIPRMGLHLLDARFDYTVHNVDHHPTLIYGTFNGRLLFAEASVTLATLQDVVADPDYTISYPFRQPRRVQGGVPWPTRFTIEYLPRSDAFRAGFSGLRSRR